MKLAAGSALLLFSVSMFGQSLTGNAASASAGKRIESLKLFNAPGINPEQRAAPPATGFSAPRRPTWIINKIPVALQRVCASPLLEAKPPANDENLMPVIRPSPPPTGGRETFAPMPGCDESVSGNR
jgi:hypothetical protein